MNHININFNYKFIHFLLKRKNKNEGFTLAELIVSGFVSLLVLLAGFTFLKMNLELNKSDETSLKLGGKITNALDFIVDEINSSKRVITNKSDVPNTCSSNPKGDFVLALQMPDQAKDSSSYKSNNMTTANRKKYWITIAEECPIFYNLVRDTSNSINGATSYILQRTGPSVNEKGFYNATDIKTTVVVDKIKSRFDDDFICGYSTGNTKSISKRIKGIALCSDENGRGAEIMINAETPKNYQKLNVAKSSGGYVRINDKDLFDLDSTSGGGGGIIQNGCEFFGTCITRKKLTFFIDVSGSMGWTNGKPGAPRFIDLAKEKLIGQLLKIPTTSEKGGNNPPFRLQIYKFNSYSTPLFRGGPQPFTAANKQKAIKWVTNLRPGGGTNPWQGLSDAMKSINVEQVVILSDGITQNKGRCWHNRQYMNMAECFAQANTIRKNNGVSDVNIEAVSLGYDFCSGNSLPSWFNRYYGNNQNFSKSWLGELSTKNGGSCKHIQ